MNVGIKFCGGCNPKYDRGDVAKLLMKNLEYYDIEYVNKDKSYDIVIVLQGCERACANLKNINTKRQYSITSFSEALDVYKILKIK